MDEKILIVDDEVRLRKLLLAYFKKEGYQVLEAGNGVEAINAVKNNSVDIVILDVMMPVMDGWTACGEIRKISNVPIIMLTARGEDEDKLLGFGLGVDNYETKPFSPKVLVAKVKAMLKRTYEMQNDNNRKYEFNGLKVDIEGHNVYLHDQIIDLSPKEFDLLIYFIENKNIVLSREKILDKVWGIDYEGDARTVDTHVKRLREKLGDRACLIDTVRGSGYKFKSSK